MTDLETFVLGVVWLRGPCTAYVVRRELRASPGAVYPALKRLDEDGLIRSRAQSWGERGKQELSITPRGIEALRREKDAIEATAADLEARRGWLTRIARQLDAAPPKKRRAASAG